MNARPFGPWLLSAGRRCGFCTVCHASRKISISRWSPLTLLLQYYDLPSLLAGKLHAVLTRKYAKGRDFLERPQDAAFLTRENLIGMVQSN